MSFFDEDDEPTRRAPRPRRTAPAGGAGPDPQTLWTRRAVASGVGLLLVVFLAVVINACTDSQRKNALRTWNQQAASLVGQSDNEVGKPFFDTLRQAASQSPENLQTQISSLRAQADTHLSQARKLDTPSQLAGAEQSLLIALEFRRDSLQYIAERIAVALGNEGDVADQAIEGIAGQMQALLASDVTIRARVTPLVRDALKSNEVVATAVGTKGFLPGFSWLQPSYVADQLGTRLSATGNGRQQSKKPAPGLHGTGLVSTKAGGVTLQPDPAANKVSLAGNLAFEVTIQDQGDNPELDIPVVVTLQGGTGKDITATKKVSTIDKGASATVTIPIAKKPTAGQVYTVDVEVKPVPGEEKTDNNKATYNVLFQ